MYRPDQYLAVIVGLMFLFGIALIVHSARQRSQVRRRWDQSPQREKAHLISRLETDRCDRAATSSPR
jgi:hypothetical protein